jgi:localization factor PodJL
MTDRKSDMPWSIKGVSAEARTLAKAAAAREGLTMGEWVSRAIQRRGGQSDISTSSAAGGVDPHLQQKIQALETRMVTLAEPLDMVIKQIEQRISALEVRLVDKK